MGIYLYNSSSLVVKQINMCIIYHTWMPVADPGGDLGEPWIPPFQASYTISIVASLAGQPLHTGRKGLVTFV